VPEYPCSSRRWWDTRARMPPAHCLRACRLQPLNSKPTGGQGDGLLGRKSGHTSWRPKVDTPWSRCRKRQAQCLFPAIPFGPQDLGLRKSLRQEPKLDKSPSNRKPSEPEHRGGAWKTSRCQWPPSER
jgi:hypothetical protein